MRFRAVQTIRLPGNNWDVANTADTGRQVRTPDEYFGLDTLPVPAVTMGSQIDSLLVLVGTKAESFESSQVVQQSNDLLRSGALDSNISYGLDPGASSKLAMSFTTPASPASKLFQVSEIELAIARSINAAASGSILVSIVNDSSGIPGSTIYGSGLVDMSTRPSDIPTNVVAQLTGTVVLAPSTTYWLQVVNNTANQPPIIGKSTGPNSALYKVDTFGSVTTPSGSLFAILRQTLPVDVLQRRAFTSGTASAITLIKEVGKNTGSATTLVVSVAAAPAAGNFICLRIGFRAGQTVTVSTVVDSKGNTWSIDIQSNDSGGHAVLASTLQNVAALTTSDTITVTFSQAPANGAAAIADEFSGITSSPLDQTASALATTTNRAAGTTASTTQADELVVACYGMNGTEVSFTKTAGFSDFTTPFLVAAIGTTASLEGQYKIIASTGAQSAAATGGLSTPSSGAIATYKGTLTASAAAYESLKALAITNAENIDALKVLAITGLTAADSQQRVNIAGSADSYEALQGAAATLQEVLDSLQALAITAVERIDTTKLINALAVGIRGEMLWGIVSTFAQVDEQFDTNLSNTSFGGTAQPSIAQEFTAIGSGPLVSVDFSMQPSVGVQDVVCDLYSASSTPTGGSLLATSTALSVFTSTQGAAAGLIPYTLLFPSPATLTTGTTYWLVLRRTGTLGNTVSTGTRTNAYAAGRAAFQNSGFSWAVGTSFDLQFRTRILDASTIDAPRGIAATNLERLDALQRLAITVAGNVDALKTLNILGAENVDTLKALVIAGSADAFEALKALSILGSADALEALKGLAVAGNADALEALKGLAITGIEIVDATQRLAIARAGNLESIRTLVIAGSADAFETLKALVIAGNSDALEALKGLAVAGSADAIEALQGLSVTDVETIDATKRLAITGGEVAEVLQRVNIAGSPDVLEAGKGIVTTASSPYESLRGLAITLAEQLDVLRLLVITGGENLDFLQSIQKTYQDSYEALRGIAATSADPYETQQNTVISQTSTLVYETLKALAINNGENLDVTKTLNVTSAAAVDVLKALVIAGSSDAFESLRALAIAGSSDALEALRGLAITGSADWLEALRGIATTGADVIDVGKGLAIPVIENLDALRALALTAGENFDLLMSVASGHYFNAESDDFARTTTNGWGGSWGAPNANASWFSTDGQAHISAGAGSASGGTRYPATISNGGILIGFTFDQAWVSNVNRIEVALRSVAVGNAQAYVRLENGTSDRVLLSVINRLGASSTQISIAQPFPYGTMWWLRFEADGSTFRARAWRQDSAEPTTWQTSLSYAEANGPNLAATGVHVNYGHFSSIANSATLDDLQTYDLLADNLDTQQGIVATSSFSYEALLRLAVSLAECIDALGLLRITGGENVESLQAIQKTFLDSYEALQGVSRTFGDPYETLQNTVVTQTAALAYESLKSLSILGAENADVTKALAVTNGENLDVTRALQIVGLAAIDVLKALATTGSSDALESLRSLAIAGSSDALEALQSLARTAALSYESLMGLAASLVERIDTLFSLRTTGTENLEVLQSVQKSFLDSYEALQGIARSSGDPYETLQNTVVTQTASLAYESLRGLAIVDSENVDVTKALRTTGVAAIDALQALAIVGSSDAMEALRSLAIAPGGDPTESLQGIARTAVDSIEALLGIAVTNNERFEALQGIRVAGSESIDVLQALRVTAIEVVETLQRVNIAGSGDAIEALQGVTRSTQETYEALQGIRVTNGEQVDTQQNVTISQTAILILDAVQGLRIVGAENVDALQAVQATGGSPLEALRSIAASFSSPYAAEQAITTAITLAVESTKGIASTLSAWYESLRGISNTTGLSFEALTKLAVLSTQSTETQARIVQTGQESVENLRPVSAMSGVEQAEVLQAIARAAQSVLESLQTITKTVGDPAETQQQDGVTQSASLPIEALRSLALLGQTAAESQQTVARSSGESLEALLGLRATLAEPLEALLGISQSGLAALDALKALAITGGLSQESLKSISQTIAEILDAQAGIRSTLAMPFSSLQSIQALFGDPIDTRQTGGVSQSASFPIETLQALAIARSESLDTLALRSQTSQGAAESNLGISLTAAHAVEILRGLAVTGRTPVDTLKGLSVSVITWAESKQTLSATASASLEALQAVAGVLGLPIETQQITFNSLSQTAVLPLDVQRGLTVTGRSTAESIKPVSTNAQLVADIAQAVHATASPDPIEAMKGLRVQILGPAESVALLRVLRTANAETLAPSVQTLALLPIEALKRVSSTTDAPWEFFLFEANGVVVLVDAAAAAAFLTDEPTAMVLLGSEAAAALGLDDEAAAWLGFTDEAAGNAVLTDSED